ncbi:MAG: hypothetical protein J3R72DRAFT_174017 [Linnemannia gamsii]|nr:MAG: hypothetical protein J3R72DRAFT_174017 [Linnemannia gamsii]
MYSITLTTLSMVLLATLALLNTHAVQAAPVLIRSAGVEAGTIPMEERAQPLVDSVITNNPAADTPPSTEKTDIVPINQYWHYRRDTEAEASNSAATVAAVVDSVAADADALPSAIGEDPVDLPRDHRFRFRRSVPQAAPPATSKWWRY